MRTARTLKILYNKTHIRFLYITCLQDTTQISFAHLSPPERHPFTSQKDIFHRLKGGVSDAETPPFITLWASMRYKVDCKPHTHPTRMPPQENFSPLPCSVFYTMEGKFLELKRTPHATHKDSRDAENKIKRSGRRR